LQLNEDKAILTDLTKIIIKDIKTILAILVPATCTFPALVDLVEAFADPSDPGIGQGQH
jgi:hypothetical protein